MSRLEHAALAALIPMLVGCRVPGGGAGRQARTPALAGELLVSAAASLTDAFTDIESAFEAANPGIEVTLNFGGSSSLRAQIIEGAPVDVFASANPANMDRVAAAGMLAGEPRIFARNLLRIAVPPGNPARVRGLDEFARGKLLLGLCARAVPCGDLARQALARAGVALSIDTEEPDVRALLTKIALGELDAGIVYATDIASADGAVEGIDIPGDVNLVAGYPIAALADAPNPPAARAFVGFVLSPGGRAILARHGFMMAETEAVP